MGDDSSLSYARCCSQTVLKTIRRAIIFCGQKDKVGCKDVAALLSLYYGENDDVGFPFALVYYRAKPVVRSQYQVGLVLIWDILARICNVLWRLRLHFQLLILKSK